MAIVNKYGKAPYKTVLVHGGPGAAGELEPLAKLLENDFGIIEPYQTALTVNGQIEELRQAIINSGCYPVNIIGYSWGAWLSYLTAARYPEIVKKLILVSSGPFESKYAENIMETRFSRLSKTEKQRAQKLFTELKQSTDREKRKGFIEFGKLMSKADTCSPMAKNEIPTGEIDYRIEIFRSVWPEAEKLRADGTLLKLAKFIKCPVVAIHGDYDPHPYEGVKDVLKDMLQDFKFFLLEKCGHKPWIEKNTSIEFLNILRNVIK